MNDWIYCGLIILGLSIIIRSEINKTSISGIEFKKKYGTRFYAHNKIIKSDGYAPFFSLENLPKEVKSDYDCFWKVNIPDNVNVRETENGFEANIPASQFIGFRNIESICQEHLDPHKSDELKVAVELLKVRPSLSNHYSDDMLTMIKNTQDNNKN